jgi:hypothetical protein
LRGVKVKGVKEAWKKNKAMKIKLLSSGIDPFGASGLMSPEY